MSNSASNSRSRRSASTNSTSRPSFGRRAGRSPAAPARCRRRPPRTPAAPAPASGGPSRRRGRARARRPRAQHPHRPLDFGLGPVGPGHVRRIGEGRDVPVLRDLLRQHAHNRPLNPFSRSQESSITQLSRSGGTIAEAAACPRPRGLLRSSSDAQERPKPKLRRARKLTAIIAFTGLAVVLALGLSACGSSASRQGRRHAAGHLRLLPRLPRPGAPTTPKAIRRCTTPTSRC